MKNLADVNLEHIHAGKFLTGHEIFDYISNIQFGSAVLILDETGFEATTFLNGLLYDFQNKFNTILISDSLQETSFNLKRIFLEKIPDLTALSLEVEKSRDALKNGGVIIHNYLPHILVREEEERVLKLIETWRERIAATVAVEFYILPKNTFPSFEKKAQSLLQGSIIIRLIDEQQNKSLSFSLTGICKPDYHLLEFPYLMKNNMLLIKWGDEFTNKLFEEQEEKLLQRQEYIRKNLYSLQIKRGNSEPKALDISQRWFLSQFIGKNVADIYHWFPDKFDEVLKNLALWNLRGFIKLEKTPTRPHLKKKLSLLTKLKLKFPVPWAALSIVEKPDLIPLDVYHALRKSVTTFISSYTPLPEKEFIEKLSILEKNFQDITTRITAVNKLIEGGENPEVKIDLQYLPKMIMLAIYYGYRLKSKVTKISSTEFQIEVKDCFLCSQMKGDKPVCYLLEGTIAGTAGVVTKNEFLCEEILCKARGDESCTFMLKMQTK